MKSKLLFVDDEVDRLDGAIRKYSDKYDVVYAPNFQTAMRKMSQDSFDVISLDHDLEGKGFQDPDSDTCGMEIVRYIKKTGWPQKFKKPEFVIHSVNEFASDLMVRELTGMGFTCHREKILKRGIVAGVFDIIHPGYINLFRDAKSVCSYLIVALYADPSIEHPEKKKPIFSVEERMEILNSLRFVDKVVPYDSEPELSDIFEQYMPDIRILGNDHKGKTSRPSLKCETFYRDRKDNEWSMSMVRNAIKELS